VIDSYEFGVMVINGKKYTRDIMVFPDQIVNDWWRKEGHRLCVEDLKEILDMEAKPEVLVVGTGYYGLVKVSSDVKDTLEFHGIELAAEPTREACQTFNELLKSNRKAAAAFHLTC
jgi:hypothetical protein